MYLILSRFAYFLFQNQLLIIIIIFSLSLVLLLINRRNIAKSLAIFAISYFFVIAVFPTGKLIMFFLEKQLSNVSYEIDDIDGILVLSGYEDIEKSISFEQLYTGGSTYRLIESIALQKKFPNVKLIFSGASGSVFSGKLSTQVAEEFYKLYDKELSNITFESKSTNTYQNILFSKKMLQSDNDQKWVLLTSAFHMRRAMGVAKKLDMNFIPYPVDYRLSKNMTSHFLNFNILENISFFQVSSREIFGLLIYRILGRI